MEGKSLVFFTILLVLVIDCYALKNPAAVYCSELGYGYNVMENCEGICIFPDGRYCEEWSFFKGECGNKYSYCNLNNFASKASVRGEICLEKNESAFHLMGLDEKISEVADLNFFVVDSLFDKNLMKVYPPKIYAVSIPPYFDWHDRAGDDWMTPVKNQGSCGSCWTFGSAGLLEAQINIDYSDPNIDYDLSEQELLSCADSGNCSSGYRTQALEYIRDHGIVPEPCFPYLASKVDCSLCVEEEKLRSNYVELIRIYSEEEAKQWLYQNGPLQMAVNAAKIINPIGWGSHAIVLTGYDDFNRQWILKNSWGPYWNDNGYGRINYSDVNWMTPGYGIRGARADGDYSKRVCNTFNQSRWVNLGQSLNCYGDDLDEVYSESSVLLKQGWNLISTPQRPIDASVESVFAPITGKFEGVYFYNSSSWQFYIPGNDNSNLDYIDETMGLWVEMNESATLSVDCQITNSSLFNLKKGQNMIGYPDNDSIPVGDYFSSIWADFISVLYYNGSVWKSFKKSAPSGLNTFTDIEPGYGLLVNVGRDVTWFYNSS